MMKCNLAMAAFGIVTLVCIAWLGLLSVSINLLSFPCDSPEDPRPCAEVIPWFFATRGLLPTAAVWGLAALVVFRVTRKP